MNCCTNTNDSIEFFSVLHINIIPNIINQVAFKLFQLKWCASIPNKHSIVSIMRYARSYLVANFICAFNAWLNVIGMRVVLSLRKKLYEIILYLRPIFVILRHRNFPIYVVVWAHSIWSWNHLIPESLTLVWLIVNNDGDP